MTDDTTAAAQAERIRRLQERRAASSPRAGATAHAASPTARRAPAPRATKARRRHPAAATRIMLAGLSVASFLGIAGSVAIVNGAAQSAAPTPVVGTPAAAPPATTSATPAPALAPATASTATATKAGAASTAAPHVKSHGS